MSDQGEQPIADVAEAAAILRRLLALVEDGTLTAPSGFVERLHGALVALDTVSQSDSTDGDDSG